MKLSLCTWKSACSPSGEEEQIMVWGSAVLSPIRMRPCCALGKPADKLSPTTLLTLPNESNPQFKLPGGPLRATLRQVEGGLCAPLSPNPSRLTSALYLSPSPTLRQNQFSRNQVTGGGPSGLLKEGEGGWRGAREAMPWAPVCSGQRPVTFPCTFILCLWAVNQASFKPTKVFQFLLPHRAP